MKLGYAGLVTLLVVLFGCTSFRGIAPIYPEVGNPNYPQLADSLQPTFKWQPVSEPEITYDFIMYEVLKNESFMEGTKRFVGKKVYYRQGLIKSEHTMEEILKPGSEYYWSVRTRRGDKISEWSIYDYTLFLGTAYVNQANRPFIFKTPAK